MNQAQHILEIAQNKRSCTVGWVLRDIDRSVPGSVHYSINDYKKQAVVIDDTGMLVYV